MQRSNPCRSSCSAPRSRTRSSIPSIQHRPIWSGSSKPFTTESMAVADPQTASDVAVSLKGVTKTFASGVTALDGLDLDLRPGELVSLLGPSGCGKSTALRLIAGLMEPTRGTVVSPGARPGGAHGRIGFVFQEPTLMPWATVAANVRLPLSLRRLDGAAVDGRVAAALKQVGLDGFEHAYSRELSGGM